MLHCARRDGQPLRAAIPVFPAFDRKRQWVTSLRATAWDGRRARVRRVKLDKIDQRILRDLQANGRISNVELARRAGISAPPCLRRVRALERAGYVRGYHAELEPRALGFTVTVFAYVGLESQAEADLQAFEALVAGWPEVRECYMLAGETDFLLKVVAADWDAYEHFLTSRLTAAPKVTHVKSALSIRTSKCEPGVPIPLDGETEYA
jgi:DNA-binding Lrp family transcriptional regulator